MVRRTSRRGLVDPKPVLLDMSKGKRAMRLIMDQCAAGTELYSAAKNIERQLDDLALLLVREDGALDRIEA